jgi:hypothetical protein
VTSNLPVGSRIVLTIMVSDGGRATTSAYVAQNSKKAGGHCAEILLKRDAVLFSHLPPLRYHKAIVQVAHQVQVRIGLLHEALQHHYLCALGSGRAAAVPQAYLEGLPVAIVDVDKLLACENGTRRSIDINSPRVPNALLLRLSWLPPT